MKKIIIATLLVILLPTVFSTVYNDDEMLIYWTSDKNVTWSNATNYPKDGGIRGSPEFKQISDFVGSGATSFDATTYDMITFGGDELSTMINLTVGCWINKSENNVFSNLFGRDVNNGANEWRVYNDDRAGSGTDNLIFQILDNEEDVIKNSGINDLELEGGHKNLIVLVLNYTSNIIHIQLFINTTSRATASEYTTMPPNSTYNITFGGTQRATTEGWTDGYIDECFVINKSLDSDEINYVWTRGSNGQTLMPFDATVPLFISTSINNTLPRINDNITVSGKFTDETSLSSIWVAYNITGTWLNFSSINYSDTTFSGNLSINVTNNITRGNVISFKFTANDTFGNSVQSELVNMTIANTLPSATNVSITELPITAGDELKGHCNFSDLDGDTFDGNQTLWYINKTLIDSANNTFILKGGNVTESANITLSCRVNDTFSWGNWKNSSIATAGDSTSPNLDNCTLQYSTLTDATGNTNTITCVATDALSDVSDIKFNLMTPVANLSRSFSFYDAQSVRTSYIIFQLSEALTQGSYSITNITYTDSSGNSGVNKTTYLNFTVTEAPSSEVPPTGGGGGGSEEAECGLKLFRPQEGGLISIWGAIGKYTEWTSIIIKNTGNNSGEYMFSVVNNFYLEENCEFNATEATIEPGLSFQNSIRCKVNNIDEEGNIKIEGCGLEKNYQLYVGSSRILSLFYSLVSGNGITLFGFFLSSTVFWALFAIFMLIIFPMVVWFLGWVFRTAFKG